jgi:hypothetical protein
MPSPVINFACLENQGHKSPFRQTSLHERFFLITLRNPYTGSLTSTADQEIIWLTSEGKSQIEKEDN